MLKCPICGMIINEKNYNFNEAAFSIKNSKTNIIYCPFCGVDISYLQDGLAGSEIVQELPDKDTSLIIDHAMKLEVYNGDFYRIASEMAVDENIKATFKALSSIELMHAGIHKKLGSFSSLPVLKNIDYSSMRGDDALLIAAGQREEHAVAYYKKYYASIKDRYIKYIFEALSDVEEGHIAILKSIIK